MTCLARFCGSSKFGGLVVTEVNPDHDAGGSLLAELVDGIVAALKRFAGSRQPEPLPSSRKKRLGCSATA
jgi:hypothetical protein